MNTTRGSEMGANSLQIGGEHYQSEVQHWDYVVANNLDYFQGQITKYVSRWKNKNGVEDLLKARHFLDKYIEVVSPNAQEICDRELAESMRREAE